MRVPVNRDILKWLEHNNVSTHYRGERRWKIGDFVSFDPGAEIESYVGFFAGFELCRIGSMSYTNSPVPIDISIGRYCSIAPNVIFAGLRHPIDNVSTSAFTHAPQLDVVARFLRDAECGYDNFLPNPQRPPLQIEHDVWIGSGAVLLGGIILGTGSVIAAGSVVTKSVAPYTIVAGNPARPIRERFPSALAAALLRSQWWEYKFTDFAALDLAHPERFLDAFEERKPTLEPYRPKPLALAALAALSDAKS
jgi:virginiamycin A acetyltransferase